MKLEDIKIVLSKIGVNTENLQPTSPNQLLIPCPLAPWLHPKKTDAHPSCSIRFGDPERSTLYNCFSCHEQGKLWNLVHTVGSLSKNDDLMRLGLELTNSDEPTLLARLEAITQDFDDWVYSTEKDKKLTVLHDRVLNNFHHAWVIPQAKQYLESRGINASTANQWQLRYDSRQRRILFPVRGSNGELVGAVGRRIVPDVVPKYYNYFGFETGLTLGGLHKVTRQPRIGVCEGFFDLINVYDWAQEAGYDMVCTFTSRTSKAQAEILAGMDSSIRYFYDMDKAGNLGWEKAQKILRNISYGLQRVIWPDKNLDIGEFDKLYFEGVLKGTIDTVTTTINDEMSKEI